MYYEEKEINGVLCCRNNPFREFEEMSKETLTKRINKLQWEVVGQDIFEQLMKDQNDRYYKNLKRAK